jgi:hypothetical protein
LTLGKNYIQDEALDWGYLTQPEQSHRLKMGRRTTQGQAKQDEDAP